MTSTNICSEKRQVFIGLAVTKNKRRSTESREKARVSPVECHIVVRGRDLRLAFDLDLDRNPGEAVGSDRCTCFRFFRM